MKSNTCTSARARLEPLAVDCLDLEAMVPALRRRVVVAVALATHAAHRRMLAQHPLVVRRAVLAAAIRMHDHAARSLAPPQRHRQAIAHQRRAMRLPYSIPWTIPRSAAVAGTPCRSAASRACSLNRGLYCVGFFVSPFVYFVFIIHRGFRRLYSWPGVPECGAGSSRHTPRYRAGGRFRPVEAVGGVCVPRQSPAHLPASAASALSKNSTFSHLGRRADELGRQYTPVVRTA